MRPDLPYSIFTTALTLTAVLCCLAAEPDTPPRTPEEVVVTGEQSLYALQQKVFRAEDRMYGMFNDLNDDDRYDIHCLQEKRTGTTIQQRECRPQFMADAESVSAKAFLSRRQGGGAVEPPPVQAVLDHHYPILRQKMRELNRDNAGFRTAVEDLYELREQLKARQATGPATD